ncbi:MAG: DNA-3-methyladenine glycosylase [Vallitaleaceae bacterium]|nr:DNA-3-methyladenine glycosylase [Vallitaleaceae bacterium]
MEKLNRAFYERDTLIVARELLGKILVHQVKGEQLQCVISDVEAYTGVNDRACHAFGGRLNYLWIHSA